MDPLDFGRWQFGITTVYHFFMVPLTLGLGLVVTYLYIRYVRTKKDEYKRMTKFWGKLYLINFAMGVATGLVQEFQFGMAWSEYSRFVGDVFGAPLAMEGLFAFFVESTFLGLWIFGWDRLKPAVHAFSLFMAVLGSWISAFFILVANSWMQHPVGAEMIDGRPQMTDIGAVLLNPLAWVTFAHVITSAIQVAGGFLVGIAWYKLWRRRKDGIDKVVDGKVVIGESDKGARDKADFQVWFKSLRLGAVVGLLAFAGIGASGHMQAQMMIHEQPLKMAAAEAACHDGTSFSVLTVGELGAQSCDKINTIIEVPGVLSFLAHDNFDTPVKGIQTLLPEYEAQFGTNLPNNPLYGERAGQKIDYLPSLEVSYWGFRGMIGLGAVVLPFYLYALWVTRKKGVGTVPESKLLKNVAVWSILAPFFGISLGWIFTEMGRQPFVVAPLSDFQITIPEIGVIKAAEPPLVIITSNRTREIHDAIKRRCFYYWVDYPSAARELEILRAKVPAAELDLAEEVVAFVQKLRGRELFKLPGVAETIDWADALLQLDQTSLSPEMVDNSLGALLKYQDDIAKIRGTEAAKILDEIKLEISAARVQSARRA